MMSPEEEYYMGEGSAQHMEMSEISVIQLV